MADRASGNRPRSSSASRSQIPRIPGYHLLRQIGAGGFGEVWLCRSLTETYRAIKIVRRKPPPDDLTFDREFAGLKRFEPISLNLEGSVSILHVGRSKTGGYFYYLMEAADDMNRGRNIQPEDYSPRTLSAVVARQGRLPLKQCVELGLSLTAALRELHGCNLVHRDIKPSNVIFVDGVPKLADIGLVIGIGEPQTSGPGTNGFCPPEGSGNPAGDLFSLGRLLYVVWTGYDALAFPELSDGWDGGGDSSRQRSFNNLILKACEFEPSQRFKSAQAMQDELRRILNEDRTRPKPGRTPTPTSTGSAASPPPQRSVTILCHSEVESDQRVLRLLEAELSRNGYSVLIDCQGKFGVEWVRQIERKATLADAVVALLSGASIQSEMMAYELELAQEASLRRGKPRLIPVRLGYSEPLPNSFSRVLDGLRCLVWEQPAHDDRLVREILEAMESPGSLIAPTGTPSPRIEAPWGAMPLGSMFYVVRPADHDFRTAIARRDSIVLVRGARQMGKSSLLARGLDDARTQGVQVVFTDFQALSASDFESLDRFYHALGDSLADQLELEKSPEDTWNEHRSPNINFDRYLRHEAFDKVNAPIVWGLDEVDRLFACEFRSEVFGMFRSWHNKRALDPDGPWASLTLAMAYATEARLFITDLNQSPFNVGTRLTLEDFDQDQVADLNHRYGNPLKDKEQLVRFFKLVNGHPFLVRRAFHELATKAIPFDAFEAQAAHDEGIFGDHLLRMLVSLGKDPALLEVVRGVLGGSRLVDADSFCRLRSGGVMAGETAAEARFRCQVYEDYLRRHLS